MTKIKVCGLFRQVDITYVNRAMPDYIGFVFADGSTRFVTERQASTLRQSLDPRIVPVGVFRNAPIEQIARLYQAGTIAAAQLHGNEDAAYLTAFRKRCRRLPMIQAFSISTKEDVARANLSAADYILLDHGTGGTGEAFDWSLIKGVTRPYFLAGGIDTGNIEEALTYANEAIDVSSGAETSGVKDEEKIAALVSAAHGYSAS